MYSEKLNKKKSPRPVYAKRPLPHSMNVKKNNEKSKLSKVTAATTSSGIVHF